MERRRAVLFPEVAEDALRGARAAVLREVVFVTREPGVDVADVRRAEVCGAELAVGFDELVRNLPCEELCARAVELRESRCDGRPPRGCFGRASASIASS